MDNFSADYWLSASGNPGTNTFALAEASDITAIYVWQYNRSGYTARQVVSFSLAFSTDNGTTYPTTITGLSLATVPGTAPILPQTVTFAQQSGVTHIKMVNMVNGGDGYTGLCEVRFGSGAGLPAPDLFNLKAQTITETSADLVGQLVDGAADVSVFWDTENRGRELHVGAHEFPG